MSSTAYLQLSNSTITPVRIGRFINSALPRIDAVPITEPASYTSGGTVVTRARNHPAWFLWNVEAIVSEDEADRIRILWALWEAERRAAIPPTNSAIVLEDRTLQILDVSPTPSRSAIDTPVQIAAGVWRYHARFKTFIPTEPALSRDGRFWQIRFVLHEIERMPPV